MSWRVVIRNNIWQKVQDRVDAATTDLRHAYPVRPASFPELPAAYVGDIRMEMVHDAGTKRTRAECDIHIIHSVIDNEESKDTLDVIVDALEDDFTADPHVVFANTVSEPTGITDTAEPVGSLVYTSVILTIGNILIQEGR